MAEADPHMMAMQYLARAGSDTIAVIDSEEMMAAAIIYSDLVRAGLAFVRESDDGAVVSLTADGMARAGAVH